MNEKPPSVNSTVPGTALLKLFATAGPATRPEKLPVLPTWLTDHREIRESGPIRAVYDFLAKEVPAAIDLIAKKERMMVF